MTIPAQPVAELSVLRKADGSASYSENGYTIIGSVNGPIEVQRRDELPDEAAIDVIIRPANGTGGVRERHLESILHSTLRHIILVQQHPRTLVQVTLQITESPDLILKPLQASSFLPILPALLQTSMLVLVSASLPLAATFTSTIVTISPTGKIQSYPTPTAILESSSIHVFSFSSSGDPLLAESEGEFSIDEWDKVFNLAQELCCGHVEGKNDGMMEIDGGRQSTQSFLVDTISKKVEIDLKWKEEFN